MYGTQHAGRGFWKKLRRENCVLQAIYTLTVVSKLLVIIAPDVDDLLYTFDGPVGLGVISHIKQHLVLSTESECNFS